MARVRYRKQKDELAPRTQPNPPGIPTAQRKAEDIAPPIQPRPERGLYKLPPRQPQPAPVRTMLKPFQWQERVGYQPGYWEHPQRVARYYNAIQGLPPGSETPSWLNREEITQAYEYLRFRNNNRPWWEWQYLNADDPGRGFLAEIAAPPAGALWPGEEQYSGEWRVASGEYKPTPEAELGQPDQAGLTEAQWNALQPWQRWMVSIFSSGMSSGATLGGVLGLPAAIPTGGTSVILGSALGAGLGGLAQASPGFAKAMLYLDYPAEWFERALGTAALIHGEAQKIAAERGVGYARADPMAEIRRVLASLPAAWKAAHLTYETLPFGRTWTLQSPTPTQEDNWGIFFEAYERIRDGENATDVYNEIAGNAELGIPGRMGFTGQAREMLGHIILDPLNVIGGLGLLGEYGVAAAKGDDLLKAAVGASKGPVEALRKYGTLLQKFSTTEELSEMGGFTRWLADVDEMGRSRLIFNNPKGGNILWNFFHMTPQSRANEVINQNIPNIAATIDSAIDPRTGVFSPEDAVKLVHGMAKTPLELARELGSRVLGTPEAAVIPMALNNPELLKAVDSHLAGFQASEARRVAIYRLAEILGQDPHKLVGDLSDESRARVVLEELSAKARDSGDQAAKNLLDTIEASKQGQLPGVEKLDPQSLMDLAKPFRVDHLPLSAEEWRAQLFAILENGMAKWAVDWFGVKPDPAWIRMSNLVKTAQGAVLLDANPTYYLQNMIGNRMTMAATGVFGLRSAESMATFWKRMGIDPPRLRAGVGMDASGIESAHMVLRAAVTPDDWISNATEMVSKMRSKVGLFSILSAHEERAASAQATTAGGFQAWSQLWRPGVGFDDLPPTLRRQLENVGREMGIPDLPEAILSSIRGSLNRQEIETGVWQGLMRRDVHRAIPEVAARTGLKEAEVAEAFHTLGVTEPAFAEKLAAAKTQEEIAGLLGDVERRAGEHLDRLSVAEVQAEAAHVAARIGTEGAQAALEIFDGIAFDFSEHWFNHFVHMEETSQAADLLVGPAKGMLWDDAFRKADAGFDRLARRQAAQYSAVIDTLGLDSNFSRLVGGALTENSDSWRGFYRLRRDLFRQMNEGKLSFADVQARLTAEYPKAFEASEAALDKIDAAFVDLFGKQYGDEARAAATAWRKGIKDIRAKMHTDMEAHRAQGAQSWRDFLKGSYFEGIKDLFQKNVDGARELWRVASQTEPPKAPAAPMIPELADVDWKMGGTDLSEGMRAQVNRLVGMGYKERDLRGKSAAELTRMGEESREVRRTEIRKVAAAVTPEEVPNDPHLLAILNLGKTGLDRKTDIAAVDIGEARQALEQWAAAREEKILAEQEARKAQLELEKTQIAITKVVEAVEAAEAAPPERPAHFPWADSVKQIEDLVERGETAEAIRSMITELDEDAYQRMLERFPQYREGVEQGRKVHQALIVTGRPEDLHAPLGEIVKRQAYEMFAELDIGEPGRKLWDNNRSSPTHGQFIGSVESTYPRWYLEVMDSEYKGEKRKYAVLQVLRDIENDALVRKPGDKNYRVVEKVLSILNERVFGDPEFRWTTGMDELGDRLIARKIVDAPDADELAKVFDEIEDLQARVAAIPDEAERYRAQVVAERLLDQWGERMEVLNQVEAAGVTPEDLARQIDLAEQARVAGENFKEDAGLAEIPDRVISKIPFTDYEALATQDINIAGANYRMYLARGSEGDPFVLIDKEYTIPETGQKNYERMTDAEIEKIKTLRESSLAFWNEFKNQPTLFQPGFGKPQQLGMFGAGEDLPLMTGTAQRAQESVFAPREEARQGTLFNMAPELKGAKAGGEAGPLFDQALQVGKVRERMRSYWLDELSKTGVDAAEAQKQVDAALDLADAHAVVWSKSTGRPASEWYDTHIALEGEGGGTLYQGARGMAQFLDDGRAVLKALQSPDISTTVHELGHVFRRDLDPADLSITEAWAGVTDGRWTVEAEEKFAKGFERYLADGVAPAKELAGVFERMKQWLAHIYARMREYFTGVELTPEMRGVYNRLLAEYPEAQAYDVKTVTGRARQVTQGTLFQQAPDVRSPAFANWFGKSKVVDESGQPLVVYHGTRSDFTEFEPSQLNDIPGFYFGDAEMANWYASLGGRRGSNVMPAYLSIQKLANMGDYARAKAATSGGTFADVVAFLRAEGFDGLKRGDEWIVFDRKNIKSTFNRGTYDPGSPNILMQEEAPRIEFEDGRQSTLRDDPPSAVTNPLGSADALNTEPPTTRMQEQGWQQHTQPIIDNLRRYLLDPKNVVREDLLNGGQKLPPEVARELRAYLGKVGGQMADTKLSAIRWAENRRDAALLNYSRRYGFDHFLTAIFPYQFWYTRSALQWAMRMVDKPAWLSQMVRIKRYQEETQRTPGFPSRLRGKMKLPLPFLPDWMGDSIYVDPLRQLMPVLQLAQPFVQLNQQNNLLTTRAVSILQDYAETDEYSPSEIQAAYDTRKGPLWDKAMAQARADLDAEIENPLDFISSISSPSLPLNWAYQYATGRPERIGQLPVTRLVRSVTAMLGANQGRGINLEGPLRRALGLPELGRFEDMRIDQTLANMAAEGADTNLIQQAMIDRRNAQDPEVLALFTEAERRAAQQGAVTGALAPFSAALFPPGEADLRAIKQEYNRAWEARNAGDTQALTKFFEAYPEYEAQLLRYRDDPAERLRGYIIGQVWDGYFALPDLHRQQVSEQLGETFQDAFLNKETRSYDSIDTDTLAMWARAVQGRGREGIGAISGAPEANLELASPEVAQAYQGYREMREQQWPGISGTLDLLYKLPAEMQDAFRLKHPELNEYDVWKRQYLAAFPEIIPFATSEDNKIAGQSPEVQRLYYQYQATRDKLFPNVFDVQSLYFDQGKPRGFLDVHPELTDYWDWQRQWLAQHPEMIPVIKSADSIAKAVLGKDYESASQRVSEEPNPWEIDFLTQYEMAQMDPGLIRQLMDYYNVGAPLSTGAGRELRRLWRLNRPSTEWEQYLEGVVRRTIEIGVPQP